MLTAFFLQQSLYNGVGSYVRALSMKPGRMWNLLDGILVLWREGKTLDQTGAGKAGAEGGSAKKRARFGAVTHKQFPIS